MNSLRYADDKILMAESEEEWKSLLMNVKEKNEKASLEFNIQKTKFMASGPITLCQIDGEKVEAVILEPKKIKSYTASTFSPFICYKVMEPDAMILVF